MKIWRFYKKPDDGDDVRKRYDLYAITNHPDYAAYFMNTRDMDKFYTRCTKEDKETYAKVANENRNCVLDEYELITRDTTPAGLVTHSKIPMIMTFFEYQCVNGDEFQCDVMNEEWWVATVFPHYSYYRKKLKNALRVLEYISNYKIFNLSFDMDENDDDYSAPDLWVDEFGAFISIFKHTFK